MEKLLIWEGAKSVVIPRYSFAPNVKAINEKPHETFADIAIQYMVPIAEDEETRASYIVSNSILDNWGITVSELKQAALENSEQQFIPMIGSLEAIMVSIALDTPRQKKLKPVSRVAPDSLDVNEIYVLSNQDLEFGAHVMGNPEALDQIANGFGCGFYILPSSVHELLIVSHELKASPRELNNMVQEVNRTEVSEEEKLSDSLFTYSLETKELKKWEEGV